MKICPVVWMHEGASVGTSTGGSLCSGGIRVGAGLAVSRVLGPTLSQGVRPRLLCRPGDTCPDHPTSRSSHQDVLVPPSLLACPLVPLAFARFPASASAASGADPAPGGQCRLMSRPRSLHSRRLPDCPQRLRGKTRTPAWPPRPGPRPCCHPGISPSPLPSVPGSRAGVLLLLPRHVATSSSSPETAGKPSLTLWPPQTPPPLALPRARCLGPCPAATWRVP